MENSLKQTSLGFHFVPPASMDTCALKVMTYLCDHRRSQLWGRSGHSFADKEYTCLTLYVLCIGTTVHRSSCGLSRCGRRLDCKCPC